MILAAGFGTRLGTLTQQRPKPMLPVCGAPLVRWAALWLRHHGVREIVVNLHHLGHQIEAELGDGSSLGVDIVYSHEEGQILGTGGGLREARRWLDDALDTPIVVVNGKILVDLDLQRVLEFHRAKGAEATMVVRRDPQAEQWGSLQVDQDGTVVRLLGAAPRGATAEVASPASFPLMFTGVQVLQPRFLDRIPAEGEQCVIRTAYRSLFHAGSGLFGFVTDDYWWEHSTEKRYLDGVCNVLDGTATLAYAEHPVRGIDATASVHPTAEIIAPCFVGAGVEVGPGARIGPHVQLQPGVRIGAGVRLSRTIVWDDLSVESDVHDTIVTNHLPRPS
jgi:NDP-sugar pyrophosphorylase family protein